MPLLITWSTPIVPTRWEKRLRLYMEDALIMLKPVTAPSCIKNTSWTGQLLRLNS